MNITLSVDEETIRKSRQYARSRNTSLNQMIRDYLKKIAGNRDLQADAEEFARLAQTMGGKSAAGYLFNRDEAHQR